MEPPGSPTFEDHQGFEQKVDDHGAPTGELDESKPIVRVRPVRRQMTVQADTEALARRLALKQCIDMSDPDLNGPDAEMFEIVSIEQKSE